MKYQPIFLKNKPEGFTLLELMVGIGIVAVIMIVITVLVKKGTDFWQKGVPTKPREIVKLILEGEEGRRSIEKNGLVNILRGGYSIYGPQFDANEPITLGTSSIIIGYGIVDSQNGFCDTPVIMLSDSVIIPHGSPTTTDFIKGTPTITVISPYDENKPMGTTSLLLETNPQGDDYGLAIGYQLRQINELRNGKIDKQGELYQSIYHKDTLGNWTLQGPQTLISRHISQLEFRYFTLQDKEIPAGIPTTPSLIKQIKMVMVTLKVDNDDDKDGSIEEDVLDGIDNDKDGKVDEDYFNGIRVTTRVYFRNL